jgi:hypothetical protein
VLVGPDVGSAAEVVTAGSVDDRCGAVQQTYAAAHKGAQLALAIVDEDAYRRYVPLIERLGASGKYKVTTITSRDDVGELQYHNKGLIVDPAEYLAGLQFDTVLIAKIAANTSFACRA